MRVWGCILVSLLAAAVMAVPAGAAITLRDQRGKKLAAFESFQCKQSAKKGFTATESDAGWKITVRIQPFQKGFGFYPLFYGPAAPARFFATSGSTTYSNTAAQTEDDPRPAKKGGNLGFPGGKEKLGIAFGTAFQVGEPLKYASLGGLATCSY